VVSFYRPFRSVARAISLSPGERDHGGTFVAGNQKSDAVDAPGDVTFPSIWPTTASNAHRVKPVKLVPYG
jgi:hypothetical protein